MSNNEDPDYRLVVDWTKGFSQLYEKHDKHRTPEEIWISTMAYCSQIGETIRTSEFEKLLRAAAHGFCWMCTFVSKCNSTSDLLFRCENDFCDMVYLKFPNRCGHCERDQCICDPHAMDKKTDKAAQYKKLYNEYWKTVQSGSRKYQLSTWISTFRRIFGTQIYLQNIETLGFHFLEEAGEEARAVRELTQLRGVLACGLKGIDHEFLVKITNIPGLVEEYEVCMGAIEKVPKNIDMKSSKSEHIKARIVRGKMDLVIEFADTFSWFCAIMIKLRWMSQKLGIADEKSHIEIMLESEYGKKGDPLKCPTCSDIDCKCKFFPETPDTQQTSDGGA